jgi:hypothetical protein
MFSRSAPSSWGETKDAQCRTNCEYAALKSDNPARLLLLQASHLHLELGDFYKPDVLGKFDTFYKKPGYLRRGGLGLPFGCRHLVEIEYPGQTAVCPDLSSGMPQALPLTQGADTQ